MRPEMRPIAATAPPVAVCTEVISLEISSVALAVCTASDLTSEATAAKPRPASPARAASIVAFNARRLVCAAMLEIRLTTEPIFSTASEKRANVGVSARRVRDGLLRRLSATDDLRVNFLDRGVELIG